MRGAPQGCRRGMVGLGELLEAPLHGGRAHEAAGLPGPAREPEVGAPGGLGRARVRLRERGPKEVLQVGGPPEESGWLVPPGRPVACLGPPKAQTRAGGILAEGSAAGLYPWSRRTVGGWGRDLGGGAALGDSGACRAIRSGRAGPRTTFHRAKAVGNSRSIRPLSLSLGPGAGRVPRPCCRAI